MTIISLDNQAQQNQQMMVDENYVDQQDMNGAEANQFNAYMQEQNIDDGQDMGNFNNKG